MADGRDEDALSTEKIRDIKWKTWNVHAPIAPAPLIPK